MATTFPIICQDDKILMYDTNIKAWIDIDLENIQIKGNILKII